MHFAADDGKIDTMPSIFIGDNPGLEAVYEDRGSRHCVIITHPHSLMGGNMHNNVVMAAWDAALDNGYSALRFNFRGVGKSGGSFDDGNAEVQDIAQAVAFVNKPVIIIGYSFGAWVASRYVKHSALPCIFVSPPTAMFDFPSMRDYEAWAVIGESDQYCSLLILKGLLDKDRITVVKHVDHFWSGAEDRLESYLSEKLELLTSVTP